MKALRFIPPFVAGLFSCFLSFSQSGNRTDSLKVNGNCGSCKKHIESSALSAGATSATWDTKTKFLKINYDPAATNPLKIETAIAAAGYDTQDVRADDKAYNKLDECCQYERVALKDAAKDPKD